jgi:high-affinity nickel-transport protein
MDATFLLGTALVLGLRHGIDWDHIAALIDISGSTGGQGHRREALLLSFFYALGHAFIVSVLGALAIGCAAILPTWLDSIMERVVGLTLVVLGCYLVCVVFRGACGADNFKLQSRWMLAISLCKNLLSKLTGRTLAPVRGTLNGFGAFGIGILHGLGAETGTQVLLITAVGGACARGLSFFMLAAFVLGLIASNTAVAIVASSSFRQSYRLRPLYYFAGGTAGLLSLVLGLLFILGRSGSLPDLQAFKFIS